MLTCGGSRISHHLRDYTHQRLPFSTTTTRISYFSSFFFFTPTFHLHCPHRLVSSSSSSSSLHSKSPGEIPILSDCFSQREDNVEIPPEGLSSVAGGIVALGKFDALHIGHRELAIQASKAGVPYLLSFVGMAEVLGWEPRAPIVAKCDRDRILNSWAPFCGNIAPLEFHVEFSSVRKLTPRQFVEKLSRELRVSGVVAGENYRFGYKAAGDATELVRLCEECGIRAYIINSVMDKTQDPGNMEFGGFKERGQVSSTRVRHALAVGDMKYVSELLGRKHRLMLMLTDPKLITSTSSGWRISAPKSNLLNLPPKDGFYGNCSLFSGDENPSVCRVFIDMTHIHLELDDDRPFSSSGPEDFQQLGIEFGD